MFSVIMPYYKNAEIVGRSINSIISQTIKEFELLVIDDGSCDNIEDIISKYDDRRIRLLHKENGGVSSARNLGIKEAKGNYICFLDSDDEWLPLHLETLCKMIEKFPNADMYVTAFRRLENSVYESSSCLPVDLPEIFQTNDLLRLVFKYSGLIHTNSICLSKELVEKCGVFNEKYSHGEDTDMWYRCALLSKPVISKTVTTIYHRDFSLLTKKREFKYEWPFLSFYEQAKTGKLGVSGEKQHSVCLVCERYILSACKHLIAEGKKYEAKGIVKQNSPFCKELKKSFIQVKLLLFLPERIGKKVSESIYHKKKKKY